MRGKLQGPVAINGKAAGRGPRLADFAWLIGGARGNADRINLAVGAYRKHVELTGGKLERLEAVMYIPPLCLGCFRNRRDLVNDRYAARLRIPIS